MADREVVTWSQVGKTATFANSYRLTTGSNTTTGTYAYVWDTWNETAATTISVNNNINYINNQVWMSWSTGNDPWEVPRNRAPARFCSQPADDDEDDFREESVEEMAERQREAERARIEAQRMRAERSRLIEERRERLREARATATALLMTMLTPEQAEQWQDREYFEVEVESGNRYRLHKGYAGNVRLLGDDDHEDEALCCHPSMQVYDGGDYVGELPVEDAVIAQLLALRADEESFRRIANITVYRARRVQRPALPEMNLDPDQVREQGARIREALEGQNLAA